MAMPNPMEAIANPPGLSSDEAARRLRDIGPNEIVREAKTSRWVIFARQFNSPVIWLLGGASLLTCLLHQIADTLAIGAIILINARVGFLQEDRAERAIFALRKMTAPRARVWRDQRSLIVPATEVVPGDLLLLEAGDLVAADGRLLEAHAFSTNDASLTGESLPVQKSVAPSPTDAPLAERHDQIFMGTAVVAGTAVARVIATGMRTELGKIAHLLTSIEKSTTPLQKQLAAVSRILLWICLSIVVIVSTVGLIRRLSTLDVLLSGVSLAVAAVPEGLPVIVTIALAVGIQRLAARHVLIRRLSAVETLGAASVICTDKTGTLTSGVMTVRELWGPDQQQLLFAAAACCDAELDADGKTGVGDPTEVAILVAAAKAHVFRPQIEMKIPRVAVNPFDTERKRMSILRQDGRLYLKGAAEVVLAHCSSPPSEASAVNEQMAARGLRVIAVAIGDHPAEERLTLVGLIGFADPPRPEAIDAVAAAREAGIQTVMITGDHPVTAHSIARELGIVGNRDTDDRLVYARATPSDKLAIVRSWKARGAIVAMTGDGVNDAPALREADIGIAMGLTGTEVTREASDMILSDDNFASIVAAIREGRGVFDNIRKTLVYLLTGNIAELMLMLIAALSGLPLPLLPLHLLWINLVTDGLPALALVMDPAGADLLKRSPRAVHEPLLGAPQWRSIVGFGLFEAGVVFLLFAWAHSTRGLVEARSLAFSALVCAELFRSFAARSTERMVWEVGVLSNLRLLTVVLITTLIQISMHHFAISQTLLRLQPMATEDYLLMLGVGLLPMTMIELHKLLRRVLVSNRHGAMADQP